MLLKRSINLRQFFGFLKEQNKGQRRPLRETTYDAIAALQNEARIKSLDKKDINIFFDMDNTLFKYSVNHNDVLSLKLQNFEGFFENLEPFKEGPAVLKALIDEGYNVYILSSCCNDTYCMKEKRASLKKHFPFIPDDQIILVMNGQNKAEQIALRGIDVQSSVLVDDYYVNIVNWIAQGGMGIKKTFSGKKREIPQVSDLRELLDIF